VAVSAAPVAAAPAAVEPKVAKPKDPNRKFWLVGASAAVFLLLAPFLPQTFLPQITVFALAIVIGYYVIGNVHHALHTPLMSETNAISGVIVVGALLQLGTGNTLITVLAVIAVLIASINVFGGFTVTSRMLNMFRRA
jgi:NAD(P) transhydrogenase subunit alpha